MQLQQVAHEELVAAPHLVPGLERQEDDLRRTLAPAVLGDGERPANQRVCCAVHLAGANGRSCPAARRDAQERVSQRGSGQAGQPVRHERHSTEVIEHEAVRSAGEVVGNEFAGITPRRTALVFDAGVGRSDDPPAGLFHPEAQVSLFPVQPVSIVEAPGRLEDRASHEQAGAHDEPGALLGVAPQPVDTERFGPHAACRRVWPTRPLDRAVGIQERSADYRHIGFVERADQGVERAGEQPGVRVEEEDRLARSQPGALVRRRREPAVVGVLDDGATECAGDARRIIAGSVVDHRDAHVGVVGQRFEASGDALGGAVRDDDDIDLHCSTCS